MFLDTYGPCIAACYACATVCERCAVVSLEDGHSAHVARSINLAMDCAQVCRTAAALLSRHSDFADTVCEACADICNACAAACNQHNTRHCRQCADACLRCEALCRDIARQTQAHAAYA